MKIHKILALCLSVLLITAAGCRTLGERMAASSGIRSEGSPSSTSQIPSSSSATASSNGNANSSATQAVSKAESEKPRNGSDWVAYVTNKDHYKLHIKKADGSEDKVIVNDTVFAPCVAGEWVYYINPLIEIDKVELDGSQKTKVCDIPEMMHLNGNMAVTAEYKNGYILYKTQQLHEVGNNSSYSPCYFKLDLNENKITEANN